MARDPGLEEIVRERLDGIEGLAEKPMFGGLAWLLDGRLLCAVRDDGALIRLGKGNDEEVLTVDGVAPMLARGRRMAGWVWITPETFADEAFAMNLIGRAIAFVQALD